MRLLRSGGPFTPPEAPAGPVVLTSAPLGGWTQIPEARAIEYGGNLYLSYVNGTTTDVEVTMVGGTPVTLHAFGAVDSHNTPAIFVMDNGHLMAAYSAHNGATLWCRVSTSSLDDDPDLSDGFDAEVTIRGSGEFTYPQLIQRMSETGSPVYVWYRSGSSGSTTMAYSKSTDHGATWSHAPGAIWADGVAYWKVLCDGLWRIDFIVTDGHPDLSSSHIYHFFADDEDYKASDGTVIGNPPHDSTSATEVYDASDGPGWMTDAMYDGSGNPTFVYNAGDGSDSMYGYAAWNGSAWVTETILASAGVGIVDPAPVACLDESQPGRVFLVRYISGEYEIWRYDGPGSWSGTAITSGSAESNIYPARVHNATDYAAVYLVGSYSGSEIAFDLGITGIPA